MKRKTVLPFKSRQERHKATSIGQHLSRNASTRVSILKFTEKKFCTRTTQLQLLCAENNLNLKFSRKKGNRK